MKISLDSLKNIEQTLKDIKVDFSDIYIESAESNNLFKLKIVLDSDTAKYHGIVIADTIRGEQAFNSLPLYEKILKALPKEDGYSLYTSSYESTKISSSLLRSVLSWHESPISYVQVEWSRDEGTKVILSFYLGYMTGFSLSPSPNLFLFVTGREPQEYNYVLPDFKKRYELATQPPRHRDEYDDMENLLSFNDLLNGL